MSAMAVDYQRNTSRFAAAWSSCGMADGNLAASVRAEENLSPAAGLKTRVDAIIDCAVDARKVAEAYLALADLFSAEASLILR